MPTFITIAVCTVGLVGLAYGINAEHSIQASARKEAEAWHELRNFSPAPAVPDSGITLAVVPQLSPTTLRTRTSVPPQKGCERAER